MAAEDKKKEDERPRDEQGRFLPSLGSALRPGYPGVREPTSSINEVYPGFRKGQRIRATEADIARAREMERQKRWPVSSAFGNLFTGGITDPTVVPAWIDMALAAIPVGAGMHQGLAALKWLSAIPEMEGLIQTTHAARPLHQLAREVGGMLPGERMSKAADWTSRGLYVMPEDGEMSPEEMAAQLQMEHGAEWQPRAPTSMSELYNPRGSRPLRVAVPRDMREPE
jgi:hypothetical protein